MLREKRIVKRILAVFLIVAMLLPYTTDVFAAVLTHTSGETAMIMSLMPHEGGEDSGLIPSQYISNYDNSVYSYQVATSGSAGRVQVFKMVQSGDYEYKDTLYCLNAKKEFPSESAHRYTNVGELKTTSTTTEVANLKTSIGDANYNALLWLIDNMYYRKQSPEIKLDFINKAFASQIDNVATAEYIASMITDDDIDVVQQWAIWYFTNGNTTTSGYSADYLAANYVDSTYSNLGTIYVKEATNGAQYKTLTEISPIRANLTRVLYDYLVTNAKTGTVAAEPTYQAFAMSNSDLTCSVDGNYYKVGPFKITSGTADAVVKVVDRSGDEIDRSKYEILKAGESSFTTDLVGQIFDTNYYIYIPVDGNTISTVRVTLDFNNRITKSSLWIPDTNSMQPMVLITRQPAPSDVRGIDIDTKIFDLALRKYIVRIGNTELTNRVPTVDPSTIATTGTATYKHVKTPITVEPGQNVVFELRVYNEGTLDGAATEITDYLPAGMTLATGSTINNTYGWVASADGRSATTTYLASRTLTAYTGSGSLSNDAVQIECTVASDIADNLTSRLTLTNVAEITGYSRLDNDSSKSIDGTAISSSWKGDSTNPEDLTIVNFYYKGVEDDDDFEKVSVDPIDKKLDLALRKYAIKVGDTMLTDRIPTVDPSTIATTGTATYKHKKDAVEVKASSKVVYEIRVYNEGEKDGTATEITDFLPAGMTLAPYTEGDGSINDIYDWVLSMDGKYATTDYLKNSTISAYTGSGVLDSLYVQIECVVDSDIENGLTDNRVLTNVAAITGYSDEDKDSSALQTPTAITDSYSGHVDNKLDLTDPTYFYKGQEDDDDFEKAIVKIRVFDLALKKFVTKINGTAPTTSREPVADVTRLADGTSNDAAYTTTKTALEVKKGDIVTYKIRVYNEGKTDGYAEEISDYLPAGLGYLMNYKSNITNKWTIPTGAQTIKLSEVDNGTANVKVTDFAEGSGIALADQIVVKGAGTFTSTALSSTSTTNLIPAFNGTTLSYKDVEITCIVLSEDVANNNLRNIAEIKNDSDLNGLSVQDRDSIPGTVDPNNYPDGEKTSNNGNPQDDHDYENLITPTAKFFDLALQKFITKLNNDAISNRVPTVTKNADGTFRYNHTSEPLAVANTDEITYTIRVYNEGAIDGYAKEVMDDIPKGLEFLPDNSTNKTYEWKMYDKSGRETTDVKQAVTVKTSFLSKEKETDSRQNIIKAYDETSMQTPAYRDVQIVFKVTETALTDKTKRDIINTAEIAAHQDKDGNSIDDRDSTPANNKDGEDDIDKEKVNVKYFDLSLKKTIAKVIITENGKTREIVSANGKDLLKVEINRKYLAKTTVKFVYNITVTNEGQIAGYAKEVKDYIPKGLVFNQNDNPNWTPVTADCIKTEALANTLLEPGKSATVPVTLEWNKDENNLGEKINVAEISKDYNDKNTPDIDSTPDNKKEGEDDIDNVPVILSISTGEEPVYVVLSTTVLLILGTGIALIKKYVLI